MTRHYVRSASRKPLEFTQAPTLTEEQERAHILAEMRRREIEELMQPGYGR
jgi:hypothetical protein